MPDLTIPGSKGGPAVLAALLCLAILPASAAGAANGSGGDQFAGGGPVAIVVLPQGIGPEDLAGLGGAAIGLMNPGLGDVPARQTWLDVSQGARAFDSTYDTPLDRVSARGETVAGWAAVLGRARSAESSILPGLLASYLERNGIVAAADDSAGQAALAVIRRDGELTRAGFACGRPVASGSRPGTARSPGAVPGCAEPVTVLSMTLPGAIRLAEGRRADELLIFVERPPADSGGQLAIAVAGAGFGGMLRSPSTRTDGYVLSTDLAPTLLRHFGLPKPDAMTGLPVESGGELDLERLAELEGRYQEVGKRKGEALAIPLLLWIGLAALASLLSRGIYARPAVRLLCLSTVLLPAVLLLTAALSPSLAVERAVATVLPVAVAALLMRLAGSWPALSIACGLTVIPYGIDMLAGSVLTPLAVIGPNPGLGARFYGIGNELESTLMILTSVGVGAALTATGAPGRRAATVFLSAGLVATVVFATGRFGADVGAAIVFPVAAVVAAALAVGRPRLAWVGILAAAVALGLVAIVDLVSDGETHFVRSIIGGSGGSVGDVLSNRLEATLDSFTRVSRIPITLAALAVIAVGYRQRERIAGWTASVPLLRAGIIAAAAASLVGAATNDSGVLFIQVGTLYLALVLGFTWTATKSS